MSERRWGCLFGFHVHEIATGDMEKALGLDVLMEAAEWKCALTFCPWCHHWTSYYTGPFWLRLDRLKAVLERRGRRVARRRLEIEAAALAAQRYHDEVLGSTKGTP
jgi:hypothetical protein